MLSIKQVPLDTIIPLRHSVLRSQQPIESCYYTEDQNEDCFHIAAFLEQKLVSIASFYRESHDLLPKMESWRLRGMATDPGYQGMGIGSSLLEEGLVLCQKKGAEALWCNARTSAVPFYRKLNFDIKGEEFLIESIGPHFFMFHTFQQKH